MESKLIEIYNGKYIWFIPKFVKPTKAKTVSKVRMRNIVVDENGVFWRYNFVDKVTIYTYLHLFIRDKNVIKTI